VRESSPFRPDGLHSLYRPLQHKASVVQPRQAVLQALEVLTVLLGRKRALGVPLCVYFFPEVDGKLVQAFDADLEVR
jgi:hypothetical protein